MLQARRENAHRAAFSVVRSLTPCSCTVWLFWEGNFDLVSHTELFDTKQTLGQSHVEP